MASSEFGRSVDYFGLESDSIKLISSTDGATRNVTECSHWGPIDAQEITDTLYNPRCEYEIVKDCTVQIDLGSECTSVNAMITNAAIETALGAPPRLTVSGVANEGSAAINIFRLSVSLTARHRPQALDGCISGADDDLQACTLAAAVDPVVMFESGAPCASDVVRGKLIASCTVFGTLGSAGTGWSACGEPVGSGSTAYRTTERSFVKAMTVYTGD